MLFLSAALSLLSALVRRERRQLVLTARDRRKKVRVAPRRIAASLAFAALFFAGAALSAGAGNGVVQLIDPTSATAPAADATIDTTTTTSNTDAEPATGANQLSGQDQQPDPAEEAAQAADQGSLTAEATTPAGQSPDGTTSNTKVAGVRSALRSRVHAELKHPSIASSAKARPGAAKVLPARFIRPRVPKLPPVIKSVQPAPLKKSIEREPEADEPNVAATVWLYRDLPDPTPPSRRLKPKFAHQLKRISARNHVDWALALAVLRARGERGAKPASGAQLRSLTKHLARLDAKHNAWTSVLSLEGRTSFADRTIALRNLYRAVGLKALVKGFDWAKPHLEKKILNDKRITIYPGGRSDIENHRVNVRVLAMLLYLAQAHGQVTVSCLISGHRLYARPGVISAHIYGLAADISEVGGVPILGHQQPDGSITEKSVRDILLLPVELQPRQVISLLGLGGPSFPLANHYDHIHVGY
ncbi:MAG TPA: hypothetical protein VKC65_05700 [Gaiellaceae bacterium]|nr:hypothetical protein [Gaiellaceae bacterium]